MTALSIRLEWWRNGGGIKSEFGKKAIGWKGMGPGGAGDALLELGYRRCPMPAVVLQQPRWV